MHLSDVATYGRAEHCKQTVQGPSSHYTPARRTVQCSGPVRIGNTTVLPATAVRDLGVYLNADVSMAAHVTATVRTCFAALRQIRSVRRSLSREALLTLIRALVVSKLDYCKSVLYSRSGTRQRQLLRRSTPRKKKKEGSKKIKGKTEVNSSK